jgi:Fe-S-cluster containining protein
MKPDRNEPCPCGSGKKYKKCCGLEQVPAKGPPDYFAINRAVAYRGEIGRRREGFCLAYAQLKTARFVELKDKLKEELAVSGETVTCGRACVHCCSQFVVASFLESECIVHFLYSHNEALEKFVEAYPRWKEGVSKVDPAFQKMNQLGEKIVAGKASQEEKQDFKRECHLYAEQNNPCPFLVEKACSIYPVRPYVCAGYFSVSPPEWCEATHPSNHQAMHIKINLKLGADVPYFIQPRGNRLSALPEMVYSILEGGYGALATLTGVEGIIDEVLEDPEMRLALRQAGAV